MPIPAIGPPSYAATSFLPDPNTIHAQTGNWADFVNEVVRGIKSVVTTVKQPVGSTGPAYGGNPVPNPSSGLIGLLLIAVLVYMVID